MPKVAVRKGMPSVQLTREEFEKRLWAKFYDPEFEALRARTEEDLRHRLEDLRRVSQGAAHSSRRRRLMPIRIIELSIEWLEAREAILAA